MALKRRELLLGLGLLPWFGHASGASARVLVVGGGFAGATAARYLKLAAPALDVRLIEPQRAIHTCPGSNQALAGLRRVDSLQQSFAGLRRAGVPHLRQCVRDIDPVGRQVILGDGRRLEYDRLILAPGIELRFDAIEGHSAELAERIPHAWQAGRQTVLLRQQLQAMPDNGVFLMSVPENPYRCPPGPYERASLVADYLSRHKPRAKLLILDSKDSFSKQALFRQSWAQRHAGRIEWVGRSDDGHVLRVDGARGELVTEFGTRHRADVLNLIPPQRAGSIAARAGLVDASGWVPVDPQSFRALADPHIQVIGDACIASPAPKSAYCANAQAKLAVKALLADLDGESAPPGRWQNQCYSLLAPDEAVSIGARYQAVGGRIEEVAGSQWLSPLDGTLADRRREASEVEAWYNAICADTWGRA